MTYWSELEREIGSLDQFLQVFYINEFHGL